MSQSETSDSGLEIESQLDHLDVEGPMPAQSIEPKNRDDVVPRAVPIAKPLPPERLPTTELRDSSSFSDRVRRRWRGNPKTANSEPKTSGSETGGSKTPIGIELRDRTPFQIKDLFTWRGVQKNLGFLISFWVHLLLFTLLSLIAVKAGIGDSPLFLDALAAPADADEASLEVVDLDVDLELDAEPEQNHLEEFFEEQVAVEEARENAVKSIDNLKSLEATAPSNAASSSAGRERGDGKSATFFGTKASGRRFVFVVDRSTSMQNGSQGFRSNELFNRFDVATSEMLAAVSSLQPHQEFFVLMFAHNTIPMFGQESLEKSGDTDFDTIPATQKNKVRLLQWVESLQMGPGTDPRLAVEVAIKMQPDAIFMLSDGQFISEMNDRAPKTLDIVARHADARTNVPINTISLVVEETIPDMQEIARRSGGKFRFTGISEYTSQIANLRGPMRARALRQVIAEGTGWLSRKKLLTDSLLPMLREPMPIERLNGEALLHQATMGLFADHVDSVLKEKGRAVEQWNQIVREIDAFHDTGQITTLSETNGDLQRLLYVALEQPDDAQLFVLLDKLDLDTISTRTMVLTLHALQRFHKRFDTTAESIGWTRFLIARLDGKRVKTGPKPATTIWSVDKAEQEITKLFADRQEQAKRLHTRFSDKDKAARTRERIGVSVVEKYPETQQAFLVRQELDKIRIEKAPVSIRIPLNKKNVSSEPVDPLDPFAR